MCAALWPCLVFGGLDSLLVLEVAGLLLAEAACLLKACGKNFRMSTGPYLKLSLYSSSSFACDEVLLFEASFLGGELCGLVALFFC